MLNEYENEIVCDLAEYYHVADYRRVSPRIVSILISGLREGSRLVLKLSDRQYSTAEIMNAMILDRLSILCWQNTKDASRGRNKPKLLSEAMIPKETKESEIEGFESGMDFESYRNEIIRNRK